MAVESCGLPIHFKITGDEVHDSKEAPQISRRNQEHAKE